MAALITRLASSFWQTLRHYAAGLIQRIMTVPVFIWAQAIAFKVIVTLLPLILLATGIFGLVLRQDNPFETVADFLQTFLPRGQSAPLIDFVFALQKASGTLTIVGSVALLLAVLTLFSTLRYVIGAAMGENRQHVRAIMHGYVFDLRMIVQVGTLFLLSFGLTLGVSLLNAQSGQLAAQIGLDPALTAQAGRFAARSVAILVPYLLTVGMLVQLYLFVPRPHAPFRSAFAGAAVAAVLFEASKNGFTIYATYLGNFDRYANATASEGLGGLGGVFGIILAFGVWVYLSGLILIIGAMVTAIHEQNREPKPSARHRTMARVRSLRAKRRLRKAAKAETTDPAAVALATDGAKASAHANGTSESEPSPAGDGASVASSDVATSEPPVRTTDS